MAGAILYNDGAFLYSNHATDPCQGHSVNSFDLVRIHRFGNLDSEDDLGVPVTKLPSYTAMCKWAADLPEVKRQMVAEREASVEEDFADLSGAEETANWQVQLKVNHKTGECDPDVDNALLILLNDPRLKGRLAKDEFSGLPKLRGDVPWRKLTQAERATGRGASWMDEDDSGLVWYMQKAWNYSSEKNLMHALKLAFDRNAFHPVREYLNGLTWDGTPRLETMFIRHLGAEDTKLTRAATRKWMCAAVKRVMVPGCKFDNCLVLVGPQNIGKSSFADVLSKGWFNDSDINMNSKDGYDSLRGSWIIELAELASTKRSDVETVKTFLSKREDTYRAAYARRARTYPRQCVFFGTTNEQEFLRDRTGNRRFWPITVSHKMDRSALESEVDQLWAEAVVLYTQGENLWMDTPELEAMLQGTLANREVQDDLEGELLEYLDTKLPDNWDDLTPESRRDFIQGDLPVDPDTCNRRRDVVCITEIKVELLGLDRRKKGGNDYDSRRVANLMNNLPGWKKSSRLVRVPIYGPQWVYYRNGTEPQEA